MVVIARGTFSPTAVWLTPDARPLAQRDQLGRDRDTQLHFPPRPIERFQLSLSQEQLAKLRLGLLSPCPARSGCSAAGLLDPAPVRNAEGLRI